MAIKEAHIVLARCPQCNRRLYGIRVEKQPDHWALTWAFPIDESKAKSEGYDETVLNGTFHPSPDYNGCPFCGTKTFLHCPLCSKSTCYHGESYATCAWCGLSGETKTQNNMSLKGGSM